jgi:xylulokinase
MSETILAYDLGTGGNKASLYDAAGNLLASVFSPYDTEYPQAGWHEQRPEAWWKSVVQSTRQILATPGIVKENIRALAISGHSLGCVPLDRHGRLLRDATPIWSDTRPASEAAKYFEKIDSTHWYRLTGNGFPPPHYTIFKILWYREHEPEMYRQIAHILGTKDYINFRLTGRIATDYSYASGAGVYDLLGWKYSDELLAAAGIPHTLLPAIVPSTEIIGTLTPSAAAELGLPHQVKVACGGVDNSCMALGARAMGEGAIYASLGSSMWIAVSSSKPLLHDAVKPYAFTHVVPNMFTSAVAIFCGGSALRWVRDQFCKLIVNQANASGRDPYDIMTELAAQSPVGSRRLMFNPSLAGGSSLEPSRSIRGAFLGLDLGHTQSDMIRATLEGIALNLRLALDELRKLGPVASEMIVVGGGSRSALWRQIFADALEMDIIRTNVGQEAGSLGAAALAAVGSGLWPDFSPISHIHQIESFSRPNLDHMAAYRRLLPIFQQARIDLSRLGDALASLPL